MRRASPATSGSSRSSAGARADVPAVLTCGAPEENVHNNRLMARRLGAPLHETPDLHNFTNWRDALDPHLTRLLARVC